VVGDLAQQAVLELRDQARLGVEKLRELSAGHPQHPLGNLFGGNRS
jgi:hypothetical protein